jgi:hypothetical protein
MGLKDGLIWMGTPVSWPVWGVSMLSNNYISTPIGELTRLDKLSNEDGNLDGGK